MSETPAAPAADIQGSLRVERIPGQTPWGQFLDHVMDCRVCRWAAGPTTGCGTGRELYRAVKAGGWR